MNTIEILEKRYSTKKYDGSMKLSKEDINNLKKILQLPASSTNIQPWHFTIVESDEAKQRLSKATQGPFEFNLHKILNASATIIFSTKNEITPEYLQDVLDQEEKDGRFVTQDLKDRTNEARTYFSSLHKNQLKDQKQWLEKQVYLNLGNFLLAAASLGFDTLAMEGFDANVVNKEFNLSENGYDATILVSVGYNNGNDFNKNLPKSRLDLDKIIEVL